MPNQTHNDNIDTTKVESQYSWNSLADFTDNIQGVQNVYRGEFLGQADKTGIIDFVTAADAAIATRVDTEIVDAIAAIKAIAGDNEGDYLAQSRWIGILEK